MEYDLSIPRMDMEEVNREQRLDLAQGRFASIRAWFVGKGGGDNEAGKLFDATNDIIRRITRYAARISEQNTLASTAGKNTGNWRKPFSSAGIWQRPIVWGLPYSDWNSPGISGAKRDGKQTV